MKDIKFPNRFAFNLQRNLETGEQLIVATLCSAKGKIENIKFNQLRMLSFDANKVLTPLGVKDINSEEELKGHIIKLHEKWGTTKEKTE